MSGPITGQKGAFKQPSTWGRNDTGNYETWRFRGTPYEVRALAGLYSQIAGISYEVKESFGIHELEVRFPYNNDGFINPSTDRVDLWEFFSQHAEKDLLETVDNAGIVGTLSQAQKETLRNKILNPPDNSVAGGATPIKLADFQTQMESATQAQNALTIYQLMQSGMRSYIMPAPALRHTIITSQSYAISFALMDVKKIISTNTLLTLEAIPTALLFNIATYTSGDVSTNALLEYGWYKMFPTIQQIARLKWQIVQEWMYGWWPIAVYGNAL